MIITVGRGNNRQSFETQTGANMKRMERERPVEYVKFKGAILNQIRKKSNG